MKLIHIILVLFMLSGCASGGGISVSALTSAMNGAQAVGDDIVEASVAKELAVMNTLKNRDNQYAKAYKESGFNITFALVEVQGVQMYLPSSIAYKPEPAFNTPLPTKPSVHPVWHTLEVLGESLAKYGLIGYGIHELNSMVSSGYSAAQGTTYNGPIVNSMNDAGEGITTGGEFIFGTKLIDNSATNGM